MKEWFGRVPSSLLGYPGLLSWLEALEPWEEEFCQAFTSLNLGVLEDHPGQYYLKYFSSS